MQNVEDYIGRFYDYLKPVVEDAAKGWPEGTFRVLRTATGVVVDKAPENGLQPHQSGYRGQVILSITLPGSFSPSFGDLVWMNGPVIHFAPETALHPGNLQSVGRQLQLDILQWAAP